MSSTLQNPLYIAYVRSPTTVTLVKELQKAGIREICKTSKFSKVKEELQLLEITLQQST